MDENNKKILWVSFLAGAVLVGVVISVLMSASAAVFGSVARLMDYQLIRHGVPLLVGFITFFVLRFHPKILLWADEVVVEVKKVVWPSKKDTTAMTIVVTVMVIISGLILGTFDWFSGTIVQLLLKLNLG